MQAPARQLEIDRLSPAGQLLVWAARCWVRSYISGHMLPAEVRERLQANTLCTAWCELSELLCLLVPRNLDPGGFAMNDATSLAPSESALLSLLQIDLPILDAAGFAVPDMPPAILRAADRRAARLVDAVRLAGYNVGTGRVGHSGRPVRGPRRPDYAPVLEARLI